MIKVVPDVTPENIDRLLREAMVKCIDDAIAGAMDDIERRIAEFPHRFNSNTKGENE